MDCNRRNFFRAGFEQILRSLEEGLVACSTETASEPQCEAPRLLRPPGAVNEVEFRQLCTACNDCITACPKQAIRKTGPEFGEDLAGFPIIIPEDNPCWLCKDIPCIEACSTGALQPVEAPGSIRMGSAVVDMGACYAAQGSICESCQEACPVRPRAVRVSYGCSPQVDLEACTGCGVCVYLCPADAIAVQPS